MIIGIAGTLGAGKGTVVEYLKGRGFKHYSGSGKLKEILLERGVEPNRDSYSVLADEIRGADPIGLSKIIWKDYENDGLQDAIFEALHAVSEAEFIKEKEGYVLGVDADMRIRYERVVGRNSEKDDVTYEEFEKMAVHEENGGGSHNIRAVIGMADHTIMNDGTVEELHEKVEGWLQSLGK